MTHTFIASILTAFCLTLIYLPVLISHQWLSFQDVFMVTQNPAVINGQSVFLTSIHQNVWMPLTLFVYRIQFLLFGLNPVVFHIVNLIVFVLTVILVGLSASRIIVDKRIAWVGALFFGILPIHASSVSAVSGLIDLLANFWIALSVFAVIKFRVKLRKRWLITGIASIIFLTLTKHPINLFPNFLIMGAAIVCIIITSVAFRFDVYLKTQEKIIRFLYVIALCGALLMCALASFERSSWWRNDLTLWTNIVRTKPTITALLRLASIETHQLSLSSTTKMQINKIDDLYMRAFKIQEKNPVIYMEYATFLIKTNQISKAKETLEQLLKISPQHVQGLLNLAQIYLMDRQTDKTIDFINQLVNSYPDNENVFLKSIVFYGRAISLYPQEKIYQEKREELLNDFEELSKRKNYHAIDFYNLALLYQQVGGREEAMRYYQKALKLNPSHKESLFNLARLTQESGDGKGALILYEKLAHDHPKFALVFLNMGLIYNSNNDVMRAKQMYQKTLEVDAHNSMAYYHLGYITENEGDYKTAIEYYEKAVEFDPMNFEAYYNLGNVYAIQNIMGESIAAYLKTVEINPNHVNAYINLSIISFKARDVQGAVKYLKKASSLGYVPPEGYLKTLEPYLKK